jgi:uncharacterized membrane protein
MKKKHNLGELANLLAAMSIGFCMLKTLGWVLALGFALTGIAIGIFYERRQVD